RGYKPTGQHHGIIPITSGEVNIDGNEVTGGKFVFDITKLEVHDLEAGSDSHGILTGHLQSEDFFDASNYTEATFEITAVEAFTSGDSVENKEEYASDNTPKANQEQLVSNPTNWVSGNLTMRGTTKNVKFPAAITVSNGTVKAEAGFNIDRTDWCLKSGDEAAAVNKAQAQFIYHTFSVGFNVATE